MAAIAKQVCEAQDANKVEYCRMARDILWVLNGAPFDYGTTGTTLGFKKTNATVRGVYDEMCALRGEGPYFTEGDWGADQLKENAKELLPSCLEFLDEGVETNYFNLKQFMHMKNTNNTIRLMYEILTERRINSWDQGRIPYTLLEFKHYYSISGAVAQMWLLSEQSQL